MFTPRLLFRSLQCGHVLWLSQISLFKTEWPHSKALSCAWSFGGCSVALQKHQIRPFPQHDNFSLAKIGKYIHLKNHFGNNYSYFKETVRECNSCCFSKMCFRKPNNLYIAQATSLCCRLPVGYINYAFLKFSFLIPLSALPLTQSGPLEGAVSYFQPRDHRPD